jgi:Mg2+-importing ATPase
VERKNSLIIAALSDMADNGILPACPILSRAGRALAATTIAIVLVAVALPYTFLAHPLGFVPLPASFLAFVALATVTYPGLVQVAKRRVFAH